VFCEGDVIGIENARGRRVPKPVGFGVRGIPNKDTGEGALIHIGQHWHVKCEGMAANLLQMRQGGFVAEPEFIWGLPTIGSGSCQCSKVCSSGAELVPERGGSVTGKSHGTCLP